MSTLLGIIVLIVVVPYLASRIAHARNDPWAGPRTPAMRGRALRAPAPARGTVRRAALSAGSAALHPGTRHIRAQARADIDKAWQQAFATDYLEDRRHARANGTAPAAGTGNGGVGTAAATRPTLRQRMRLAPYAPAAADPASGGGANGNGQAGSGASAGNGRGPGTSAQQGRAAASPPPPPPAPRPSPSANGTPPGGTVTAAGTSTAVAEQAIEGLNRIHAHAAAGNIFAKQEAIKAIHELYVRIAAMVQMLSRQMSEPGMNYGPEITEPLAKSGQHAQAGAITVSEADANLSTLLNTTVGDLARSPRQAPHHTELSEGGGWMDSGGTYRATSPADARAYAERNAR